MGAAVDAARLASARLARSLNATDRDMPTRITHCRSSIGGLSVARLHLSSDSGVNPLSSQVVAEIRETMRAAEADDEVSGLVFTSEGRCFCAGADVKEFRTFDVHAFQRYMSDVLAMYAEMIELRKPIVARVHADARGGGAALALSSDFVVSARAAKFALPESHRGLAGGGYLMPRLMGKHRAAEFVLLGRDFTAAQMLDWGLLSAVCEAGELDAGLERCCAELATIPPSAFAVGKRSLASGYTHGLREAMGVHVQAQTQAFLSARAKGLV